MPLRHASNFNAYGDSGAAALIVRDHAPRHRHRKFALRLVEFSLAEASMNTEGPLELRELLEGQGLVLELIARGESLHQVLDTLLRIIQLQCPGMLASILLLDAEGIHVRHGGAPDLPEAYVQAVDGLPIGPKAGSCGTAAFTRKQVIVGDIATDPLWDDYRALALKHDLRACWSTPIFDSERRVLGTFAMYFRAPGLPNHDHLKLIEISTHIASVAITKHRAEEEIRQHGRQLH
jgi:GAF domain-containing protein